MLTCNNKGSKRKRERKCTAVAFRWSAGKIEILRFLFHLLQRRVSSVLFEANYIQRNAAPTVEQSIRFVTIRSVSSNFSHHFRRKNAFHGPRRYEPRVRQLHAIGTAEGHQPARSGIFVSSIDLFKSRSSDRKEKKWTVRKENAEYLVVEEFIDQDAVKIRLYKLEYR